MTLTWGDVLARLEGAFDRQSKGPQYWERVAAVREKLGARGVSKEIIERVIRLNPDLREGERLRGLNYKRFFELGIYLDVVRKGWVIRKYGRDVWARIPPNQKIKRGRREYVTSRALMEAL